MKHKQVSSNSQQPTIDKNEENQNRVEKSSTVNIPSSSKQRFPNAAGSLLMQKRKKSMTKSKMTTTCDLLRIHEQMMNSQNRRKNNGRNHYNGMSKMTRNHYTAENLHKASSADSAN